MVVRTCTPETLPLGAASVIMGWAAATVHGNGEVLPAILCLFFAAFMQLYHNWNHRYFDIKYKFGEYIDDGYALADPEIVNSYPMIRETAQGSLVLAIMVGIGLMMIAGWWSLILGLIVFACATLNSYGSAPLIRTPWALVITFFVFGPLGVIGTELVQSTTGHTGTDFLSPLTGNLSWFDLGPAVFLSIPAGLMALSAHLAHGYRKYDADLDNEKHTLSVKIGRKATARLYLICALLMPVSFLLFWFFASPTPPLWLILIAPVFICAFMITRYRRLIRGLFSETKLIEADTSWAFLFLSICTYILCLTTGEPNDSSLLYYN